MQPSEAAALVQAPDRFRQKLGLRRVQAAERLVQQQQFRFAGDGARDFQALKSPCESADAGSSAMSEMPTNSSASIAFARSPSPTRRAGGRAARPAAP